MFEGKGIPGIAQLSEAGGLICPDCVLGKAYGAHISNCGFSERASGPPDLLHTDVRGPIETPFMGVLAPSSHLLTVIQAGLGSSLRGINHMVKNTICIVKG